MQLIIVWRRLLLGPSFENVRYIQSHNGIGYPAATVEKLSARFAIGKLGSIAAVTEIVIIDDHAIVRAGVKRLLAQRPDINVKEATTAEAGLSLLKTSPFDLVILDLNLPGLGGLEALKRIRQVNPNISILVFSMHDEPIFVARALEAGALGYVSKCAAPEEILTAIDSAIGRKGYIENSIAAELSNRSLNDDFLRTLTVRDLEILRLLADGRTLTEIAAAFGIAYKTVANTCARLRVKLGVRTTVDLINVSRRLGLN